MLQKCLKNLRKMYKLYIFILISIITIIAYTFSKGSINKIKIRVGNSDVLNYKSAQIDYLYLFTFDNFYKVVYVDYNGKIISNNYNDSIITIISKDKTKFITKFKTKLNYDTSLNISKYNKVFAISDIEGNFNVFSKFLYNNKIIDKDYNWIFGNGHLVCNGDFFDRGDDVTACLWLIYKLEQEAEKQGGKVHYIIGNHEEMNLRGNVKYVHHKYKALADQLKIPYKELYGKDTELGRWLRTKNSVIKINDILFSHGGLSPALVNKKYTLEEINNFTQKYIGEDEDYVKFINPRASFIFDRQGPMWYRGYFGDYKEHYKGTSQKDIDDILNYYEAKHIVVGHTIVDKVQTLFNNKVIAIDAMSENDPRKQDDDSMAVSCEGLYIENNEFYRVLYNGKKELLFKK
jgi:hypothetical protein